MSAPIKQHFISPVGAFVKPQKGHTRPQAPFIDISQPGRLRVSNLLCLLGVSHSTLYAGLKTGRYPKPDGYDGKMPFWRTETIRTFLQKC